jgi:predicted RND superfamily exporter protein
VFAVALATVMLRPGWVVALPRLTLVGLAFASALAVLPLVRLAPLGLTLSIDPSTEPLLPAGDPARGVYDEAVRDFGNDEVFVVAVETDDVFQPERLALLRRLTDAIGHMPEVRSVQSLADVVAFRWDPVGEWIDVGRFLDEIPEDPAALEVLRERALRDPLYRRTLVSDDGRTAAINVSFRDMTDKEFLDARLEERIQALLEAEQGPALAFHLAGRPHLKHAVYHGMVRDLRVLLPTGLAVLAVVLWICFGTRRAVALPLGVVIVSLLWTYGAMAFLDRPLSILTSLLGPMLIAIGSVYGVHVLGRYEEEAGRASTPAEAALATLTHERLPLGVSGATTVIGFGANLISDVPAVIELGAFSMLGVASMTLLSLTGLPALLTLMPLRPAGSGTRLAAFIGEHLDSGLLALAEFVCRRATPLLVGFAILAGGSVALIPRIVIDTDYLSFFAPDAPVRREFDAVNRLLSGAIPRSCTRSAAYRMRPMQPLT